MSTQRKYLPTLLLVALLSISLLLAGCGTDATNEGQKSQDVSEVKTVESTDPAEEEKLDPIEFSVFISDPGQSPTKDNKIYKLIQEKLGVTLNFEFLVGDKKQKVGVMVAGGDYPDIMFVDSDSLESFTGAGAMLPLEDLIEKCGPNLKVHHDPVYNMVKDPSDGHLYVMPNFNRFYGEVKVNEYEGPAFWIQKAILTEFGYPKVETLDQYFDLIQQYKDKYPTIDDQATIGFEVLCEGWRDFCLKNAPQHLMGYPNDGQVVVDASTHVAEFFWDKDYAKAYYKKLNDMYNKGIIDPDSFTLTYDQYISKLSSGRVLGMFDQHWNFHNTAELPLREQGKIERQFAPCPVVLEAGTKEYYQDRPVLNINTGFALSINNKDPERTIKFFDALLSEEWQIILGWGIEGEDFMVDDNGEYYMTAEQRKNYNDPTWRLANMAFSLWNYGPKRDGTLSNGNACTPGAQPKEFFDSLPDYDKEFLNAYGHRTWTDFLNAAPENRVSYPAWQIDLVDGSAANIANTKIDETGDKYLPQVIIAKPEAFESKWEEYVTELHKIDIQAYLDRINDQLKWRVDNWK